MKVYCERCSVVTSKYCPDCGCPIIGSAPQLSLDELKAIDPKIGQPVFLVVGTPQAWVICHGYEWIQGHVTDWISMSGYGKLSCDTYGEEWLCYIYSPSVPSPQINVSESGGIIK